MRLRSAGADDLFVPDGEVEHPATASAVAQMVERKTLRDGLPTLELSIVGAISAQRLNNFIN